MARFGRKPPALLVEEPTLEPVGSSVPKTLRRAWQEFRWDDRLTVPPVLEPPQTIFPSISQPVVRPRSLRLIRMTHMAAGPRLNGSYVAVGTQRRDPNREKMTGLISRQAAGAGTLDVPPQNLKPRLIQLGRP